MNAAVKTDSFARLLESEAKGFFFLKLALADHTNEQKLVAIVNRAHSLYDRIVADQDLSAFQPFFSFRRAGERIELVISREPSGEEMQEMGHLVLTTVHDPLAHGSILALETSLPIPVQQLTKLTLADLKKQLELYYELVDVCTATTISRMVKSFEEIQQSCTAACWTYDLSSSTEKVGLRVRKNGKSWLVLFVDIHV